MVVFSADSGAHRFPDGGIRRCFQSEGSERRSSGGDGAVGRHFDDSLCPRSQPEDLCVGEGTPGVS